MEALLANLIDEFRNLKAAGCVHTRGGAVVHSAIKDL